MINENPEFLVPCPQCKGCNTVVSPHTEHDGHVCTLLSCNYCGFADWVCKGRDEVYGAIVK